MPKFLRKRGLCKRGLGILLFVFAALSFAGDSVPGHGRQKIRYRSGEVVVKFKNTMSVDAMPGAEIRYLKTDRRFAVLTAANVVGLNDEDSDAAMENLLKKIRANPNVEYAEPNYIYSILGRGGFVSPPPYLPNVDERLPDDPDLWRTWGLLDYGQQDDSGQEGKLHADIGAAVAWKVTTGSRKILIASIDTGVDCNHPDLAANVDCSRGRDFSHPSQNEDPPKDPPKDPNDPGKAMDEAPKIPVDDHGHGTHTAGTMGAVGDDGRGIAGVNWRVTIIPVKFMNASGSGSLADALDAIKYATKLGVKVMNNSWGGGAYSKALYEAISEARDKGILFVVAAGNDGADNDQTDSYPANYDLDNVMAVAASDNLDHIASFSNWGAKKVHLAAPGVNIYSTVPGGGYKVMSGTSMASPHVAGAAALLWSLHPEMNYLQIKKRLMDTTDYVRGMRNRTVAGGRLNIGNAVLGIFPPRPTPPPELDWQPVAFTYETEHPYSNDTHASFPITLSGASKLRIHFSRIDTESNYDKIKIKDADGEVLQEISGKYPDGYTTDFIDGDTASVEFDSDFLNNGWGFAVDRYDYIL